MRGLRFILISLALLLPSSRLPACSRRKPLPIRLLSPKYTPPGRIATATHRSPRRWVCGPAIQSTSEKLQEIADGLVHLGVFSRVNFRFTVKNRRATVNFELEDAAAVPVMFENFPWFTDEELADEIRQGVPLFDGSAPRDGTLLE